MFDFVMGQTHGDVHKVLDRHTGEYPLHVAARLGHMRAAQELVKKQNKVNLDQTNRKTGDTPLHVAIDFNHTDIAKVLLKNHANVNARNKHGKSPLHIATERCNLEIVHRLLEHKAVPHLADEDGNTPLRNAAMYCTPEKGRSVNPVVDALLAAGAKINDGKLMYKIADAGHLRAVEMLLAKGADANEPGDYGITPLYVAAFRAHKSKDPKTKQTYLSIVGALLKSKADAQKAAEYTYAVPDVIDLIHKKAEEVRHSRSKRRRTQSSPSSSSSDGMKDMEQMFRTLQTKDSKKTPDAKRAKLTVRRV